MPQHHKRIEPVLGRRFMVAGALTLTRLVGHHLHAGHIHGHPVFLIETHLFLGDLDVHESGVAQPPEVDLPVLGPGDAARPSLSIGSCWALGAEDREVYLGRLRNAGFEYAEAFRRFELG